MEASEIKLSPVRLHSEAQSRLVGPDKGNASRAAQQGIVKASRAVRKDAVDIGNKDTQECAVNGDPMIVPGGRGDHKP